MRLGLIALLLAMSTSACGPSEPSITQVDLIGEYFRSTTVKNDRFPTPEGFGPEDRMAHLASMGPPEKLEAALFGAFECSRNDCAPGGAVEKAAASVADGKLHRRSVIVKHQDGSLELMNLYVVKGSSQTVVVDPTGETFTDLEDFRAGNDILTAYDTVLTLEDIASVPGEGELVVVTGKAPATWYWWVLGGVVLGAGVLVFVLGRNQNRRLRSAPPVDDCTGPEFPPIP